MNTVIHQRFIEHLLGARDHSKPWGQSNEQNSPSMCSSGTHTLMGLLAWECSQSFSGPGWGSDLSGSLCVPLAGILRGAPV